MTDAVRSAWQLGTLVREARTRKNLTQQQLADLTGVGQKTISQIENGNDGARLETVFRLFAPLELQMNIVPWASGTTVGIGDIF